MYKVNINFNEAEKAWRSNKIYRGNGVFSYKKSKKKISRDNRDNKNNTKLHRYKLRSQTRQEKGHNYNTRSQG